MQGCSKEMAKYFARIDKRLGRIYEKDKDAREVGLDPTEFPEIYPAKDLASRVEALTGPTGVAGRIRELSKEKDGDQVAFQIAEEIVDGKFEFGKKDQSGKTDNIDSSAVMPPTKTSIGNGSTEKVYFKMS